MTAGASGQHQTISTQGELVNAHRAITLRDGQTTLA